MLLVLCLKLERRDIDYPVSRMAVRRIRYLPFAANGIVQRGTAHILQKAFFFFLPLEVSANV